MICKMRRGRLPLILHKRQVGISPHKQLDQSERTRQLLSLFQFGNFKFQPNFQILEVHLVPALDALKEKLNCVGQFRPYASYE